ncbi:Response regulator transcription factor [Rubrivivax sp. A210]|uniref:response regulator n=1 Tax=Rubrivivax sp. A210 TaxID=2772301 RepID=UPI0019185195|nr:response regulator transcription factor [Rubrivivax sp. A210]CAD5373340.1 Response regulator transcription factor [Rubrivivax sp. A210]
MTLRLLLADANWLIRRGLRATLQDDHEMQVVGEAASTREAVSRTLQLQPDIAWFDLDLPGEGGLAALREVKQARPEQKVVLASPRDEAGPAREALRAGCDGYLRLGASEAELLAALGSVLEGRVYLDAEVSRSMALSDYRRPAVAARADDPIAQLTERELYVFRLIGAGHTNRSAGDQMQLSAKTVEKYRATLMRKLGLRNAVELQLTALQLGLVARPGSSAPRA